MPPVPYIAAQFTCHCYPTNQTKLARRKGLQLLSSFLYYSSLLYLDRPSSGAEVGRFKRFLFLFLALVCEAFVSVCGDSNVLEFWILATEPERYVSFFYGCFL